MHFHRDTIDGHPLACECEPTVGAVKLTALRVARGRVLAAVGGLPAVVLSEVLRRRRSRRMVFVAVAAIVIAILLIAGALARFPLVIADTASAWMLGGRSDTLAREVPRICVAPPTVSPAPAPEALPATVAADTAAPTDGSMPPAAAPPPAPLPGLDAEGRPTPEALAVIDSVPAGADLGVAQGWVLFELAHPPGAGAHSASTDFETFSGWYRQTADILSANASPLDVVTSIDPTADYSPYLLLSQVAAYRMMRQGSVEFTEEQRGSLLVGIAASCRGKPVEHQSR